MGNRRWVSSISCRTASRPFKTFPARCFARGARPTLGTSETSPVSTIMSWTSSVARSCATRKSLSSSSSFWTKSKASAFFAVAESTLFRFTQRCGMWYISLVDGSQKVTHPPSSRVMTQACSTSRDLPSEGTRTVPFTTNASRDIPRRTEHSKIAWSCGEPARLKSRNCGSLHMSSQISPVRSCFAFILYVMQWIQCRSFAGLVYS
mmetsp:Transcript_19279/g.45286  ORF Transcript_19279/g.45286 Transcript_19279/m.45286 type:complete len:206 (+) Transcript_19279:1089-1706(+)